MQSIPLIDYPRGGFEVPDLQRPMDSHFPVGPGCIDRQPSLFGQQHVNPPLTGPAHGDQVIPGQQKPMSGFSPVGPVVIKVPCNFHPGGPGSIGQPARTVQAPGAQASPDQQLRNFHEMLVRCTKVMTQITQQQQHIQQQLRQVFSQAAASAPENVMAAAPSPSVHPAQEVKQQQFEVTATAPGDSPHRDSAQAKGPWMVQKRKIATDCSVNTTSQQVGCPAAESETEGGSARDVTSDGHDHRKLVSVSEGPRQRPGDDGKDSFGQQFWPKPAKTLAIQTVTTGFNIIHQQEMVVAFACGSPRRCIDCRGLWAIAPNSKSLSNLPSPWPPPTQVLCSLRIVANKIGGGKGSARSSQQSRKPTLLGQIPNVKLINRARAVFNFPRAMACT